MFFSNRILVGLAIFDGGFNPEGFRVEFKSLIIRITVREINTLLTNYGYITVPQRVTVVTHFFHIRIEK